MRGMVYHGQNRLEHWLIDQASSQPVTSFVRSSIVSEFVPSRSISMIDTSGRAMTSEDDSFDETETVWRQVGSGFVRTGISILLVPDPLPVVDEVIGAAFIAIGASILIFA